MPTTKTSECTQAVLAADVIFVVEHDVRNLIVDLHSALPFSMLFWIYKKRLGDDLDDMGVFPIENRFVRTSIGTAQKMGWDLMLGEGWKYPQKEYIKLICKRQIKTDAWFLYKLLNRVQPCFSQVCSTPSFIWCFNFSFHEINCSTWPWSTLKISRCKGLGTVLRFQKKYIRNTKNIQSILLSYQHLHTWICWL